MHKRFPAIAVMSITPMTSNTLSGMRLKRPSRTAFVHLVAAAAALALAGVCSAQTPPPGLTNPNPIWGYADLHNHQFANLGFGGLIIWGEPYNPDGIAAALSYCDFSIRYPIVTNLGIPLNVPVPGVGWVSPCPTYPFCPPVPVHGPWHTYDLIGAMGGNDLLEPVGGYPEFDGWPRWNTFDHQQVYIDWLFRAHQGGLQLMVMHAVNNGLLCGASNQIAGFGCNDMVAVDRQLDAAKALEAYLDGQAGGAGKGWYRIVRSPQEARTAIANGQLAVVLGIEVDNLFDCRWTGNCTKDDVSANLKKYYDLGVRHMFPVHLFDNGFGGAAMYETNFDIGNLVTDGYLFNTRDCSAEGYEFKTPFTTLAVGAVDAEIKLLQGLGQLPQDFALPVAPSAECNARVTPPLGESLIKQMIGRHMIIDIDHMSALTAGVALDIAEAAQKYPVVAGHTGFVATSRGEKKSEGQKSEPVMARLKSLGALIGPILAQGDTSQIGPSTGHSPNFPFTPCSKSDWAWAQAYLYAVDAMGGAPVAFGSDFNGGASEPAPRFGPSGCGGNASEAATQAQPLVYPFHLPGIVGPAIGGTFPQFQMSAKKTNNFNVDGLSHVGMVPDMIADLQANGSGLTDAQLAPLFHSAEAYIELWERIQASKAFTPILSSIVAPAPNASGWNNTNVTVTLTATADPDGAGLASLTYAASGAQPISSTTVGAAAGSTTVSVTFPISTAGVTTISFHGTDTTGNTSAEAQVIVRVDKTAPVVACSAPDGQWHATDVSLSCAGSDAVSGLKNSGDASFSLVTSAPAATETSNALTGSHTVSDVAGNSAVAGPIAGNRVDKKPPSISTVSPADATYAVNQSVPANYTCADGGSGLATCVGTVPNGSNFATAAPGTYNFQVNATDNVGNASGQTVAYRVSYNICLFYNPRSKQSGSAYAIKIGLCDAGNANLSSAAVIVHAISVTLAATNAPAVLEASGNANADMNFRYDATLGGYIFNLNTSGLAAGTYNLNFTAGNDPALHSAPFLVN